MTVVRDDLVEHSVILGMAHKLGLKDWDFTVQKIDPDSEYGATCAIVVGRKHGVLSFPAEWEWTNLTDDQRHTVIHELLHCHFDQYKVVLHRLEGILSDDELKLTELAMRDVVEYGIDGIATACNTWMEWRAV